MCVIHTVFMTDEQSPNKQHTFCIERITSVIHNYDVNTACTLEMDRENSILFINDFLHLLHHCNDDSSFFHINSEIKLDCDIKICNAFKRNYRDRTNHAIITALSQDTQDVVTQQILDKVHCYYIHTCHMGYRVSNGGHMNKIPLHSTNSRNSKYNSLCHDSTSEPLYRFGQQFNYEGYVHSKSKHYHPDYETESYNSSIITINAKYSSLKQELLENEISILCKDQFNAEIIKASIYFESYYCRKHYRNFETSTKRMTLQLVLALMIYCNFTELSNKFSKTFWNNVADHNNFYHLGRSIKKAVHNFGTVIKDGDINKFYHGIGETLLFPQTTGAYGWGVSILSPLSTSSQIEVALNFTNASDGMIVEFSEAESYSASRYFAVSWLSDFSNESEYLFVQNLCRLQINNIIDTGTGQEYKLILEAMRCLDSWYDYWHVNNASPIECNETLRLLIFKTCTLAEYKSFKTLTKYGQSLMEIYFNNKKEIIIDYRDFLASVCSATTSIFYDTVRQCCDIRKLVLVFPNMESLAVICDNICHMSGGLISNILEVLKGKTKLTHLYVRGNRVKQPQNLYTPSVYYAHYIVRAYSKEFQALGYTIKQLNHGDANDITIKWNNYNQVNYTNLISQASGFIVESYDYNSKEFTTSAFVD
eukprot:122556_1